MRRISFVIAMVITTASQGQVLTAEDNLNAGLLRSERTTVISGYGNSFRLKMRGTPCTPSRGE